MQPPSNSSASSASGDPALPGIAQGDTALMKTLTDARLAKGPDYKPRTHHLLKGGAPKFTNRLVLETSPYLLQHAHNPVNWRAWGDEAFARAKEENKPVLLSVGYSTCHWCHVMERESFEDEEIAAYINRNYIAIKVDREERPDVDDIYMSAVQLMSGRGGWPMTVVLTPEREPFFGATYIPARDGDRGSRTGFYTILQQLKGRFDNDGDAVVAEAKKISERIRNNAAPARPGTVAGPLAMVRAAHNLAMTHDPVWGGFGNAPKFPRPATLDMLLRYHRRTRDPQALAMVVQTLKKMAAGGMYDHVGGGFHRYSTDKVWLVPHFEKMLYDNAQLTVTYLEAYQVTGEQDFARVAREVLDYVIREMTDETYGFYSATDADSPTPGGHEEEGYFFTWTPKEVMDVVGNDAARSVNQYYGVTPVGNFENRTIFNTPRALEDVAKELGKAPDALRAELEAAKAKLYNVRKKRPPPGLDDKILTSWNGLMISAFAKGGLILDEPRYTETAVRAAAFMLAKMRDENGRLLRSYKDGRARHMGFLDDYAFLIQGLLDVYESTFDAKWLKAAKELQAILDKHYGDDVGGGYYMTADDQEKLLARDKPSYDGAEPSGNSVAALNLLRFEEFTTEHAYRVRAEKLFGAFAAQLTQQPTGVPKMVVALDYYLDTPLEILIVAPEDGNADELLKKVRSTFLPNRILTVATGQGGVTEQAKVIPLIEGKLAIDGKATAFVCEKSRCDLPTSDANQLAKQLARVQPLMENLAPLPVRDPASEPKAWEYNATTNKHWHPGHGHWHDGRPPAGR